MHLPRIRDCCQVHVTHFTTTATHSRNGVRCSAESECGLPSRHTSQRRRFAPSHRALSSAVSSNGLPSIFSVFTAMRSLHPAHTSAAFSDSFDFAAILFLLLRSPSQPHAIYRPRDRQRQLAEISPKKSTQRRSAMPGKDRVVGYSYRPKHLYAAEHEPLTSIRHSAWVRRRPSRDDACALARDRRLAAAGGCRKPLSLEGPSSWLGQRRRSDACDGGSAARSPRRGSC
jgi:hypothetical protein